MHWLLLVLSLAASVFIYRHYDGWSRPVFGAVILSLYSLYCIVVTMLSDSKFANPSKDEGEKAEGSEREVEEIRPADGFSELGGRVVSANGDRRIELPLSKVEEKHHISLRLPFPSAHNKSYLKYVKALIENQEEAVQIILDFISGNFSAEDASIAKIESIEFFNKRKPNVGEVNLLFKDDREVALLLTLGDSGEIAVSK